MKRKGAALAVSMGLIAAARTLQAGRATVLTYHGVLSDTYHADDFLDHNFVSASEFDRQLAYLCAHYRPISLEQLVQCYAAGVNPPKKSVVITFDDGFANNCSVAWPLLKRRNVPFTIFVTTGMVGVAGAQLWTERVKRAVYLSTKTGATLEFETGQKQLDLSSRVSRAAAARATVNGLKRLSPIQRDAAVTQVEMTCGRPALRPDEQERYEFLSWEQIRTMAAEGVEFGSHTVNHPILTTLEPGVLRSELQNSKRTLETQIRRECYSFAFPNGSFKDYGLREKAELSALGYRCALSLNGTLNGRRSDLLELDRININRQHDDDMFRAAAAGLLGRVRRVRERWTTSQKAPATTGEVRP